MNKTGTIRRAVAADAQQCLNIYHHYAENTAFSFEQRVPDVEQMAERIGTISQNYPWLVYEDSRVIQGYAYASQFRPRPAYRWTAEVTIYLSDAFKGSGIAGLLYQKLFDVLVSSGFYNAVAVITEPNPESEKFHQKMGFNKIGTFNSIGYKLGQWHDIGWWQKPLAPCKKDPAEPIVVTTLH